MCEIIMNKYCLNQVNKIACANVENGSVLQVLRTEENVERGLFLKDIGDTIDYEGSFDKEEVIDYNIMVLNNHNTIRRQIYNDSRNRWKLKSVLLHQILRRSDQKTPSK